jgi:hypothetical protein
VGGDMVEGFGGMDVGWVDGVWMDVWSTAERVCGIGVLRAC